MSLIGTICGDVIGSCYEGSQNLSGNESLLNQSYSDFTDDTILSIAVADSLLNGIEPGQALRKWFRMYPKREYFGGWFKAWAISDSATPPESNGNGAAMRVSPISMLFSDPETARPVCLDFTNTTHNSDEARVGSQAIMEACMSARLFRCKSRVREIFHRYYPHKINLTLDQCIAEQCFETRCDDTVPKAFLCALESDSFDQTMRNCLRVGGDVDTIAAMSGGIAEWLYGVPFETLQFVKGALPIEIWSIINSCYEKACIDDWQHDVLSKSTQSDSDHHNNTYAGGFDKLKRYVGGLFS